MHNTAQSNAIPMKQRAFIILNNEHTLTHTHKQTSHSHSFHLIRFEWHLEMDFFIIIAMKGTPHHFNLDCFVGSVITVIGKKVLNVRARVPIFCFVLLSSHSSVQLCRFHYCNFFFLPRNESWRICVLPFYYRGKN